MLKKLLKNTAFRYSIREFYKKNEHSIIDIVLFGSAVRGKEQPKDIDLMLIFKKNVDKIIQKEFRKTLETLNLPLEITAVSYKELFSPNFIAREAFILEGYSLINNLFVGNGLGLENMVLFRYKLGALTKSERMRFYFSLYGRNKRSGMLDEFEAIKFSEGIIIVPVKNSERFKVFLFNWKIKYTEIPLLMPKRIVSSKIFQKSSEKNNG